MVGSGGRLRVLVKMAFMVAAALPAAAQQLDSAYLGTWASDAKECSAEFSDARFEITQTGMSGPEFYCTTITAVRQGDGWAVRQACAAVIRRMALDRYRIVTFATHGILAGELRGVSEPALVLAMPANPQPDNDGLLTASEVSGPSSYG